MRKLDITRPRNNCFFSIQIVFALVFSMAAVGPDAVGQDAGSQPPPAVPVPVPPPSGSAQVTSPQDSASTPQTVEKDEGMFVMHKSVEEVALHATVIDEKDHLITNLDRSAFSVAEDGVPQTITSFRHEDIPVSMGIVIDNSGSMREKREKVNQAALNLVRSSNAQDEVFIVNFNDEYYLDQDFTNDLLKLKEALEKIDARGGTALFDAVVASADHVKRNGRLEKKVLFIVTDGADTAS